MVQDLGITNTGITSERFINPSIRTRFSVSRKGIETTQLVVKSSIEDANSENGVMRFEGTVHIDNPLPFEQMTSVIDKYFPLIAKWSRYRKTYDITTNDNVRMTVCLDKNAGYGYIAEFEIIGDEETTQEDATRLRTFIASIGLQELSQDRLARMYDHYNAHWAEYYGTDRIS